MFVADNMAGMKSLYVGGYRKQEPNCYLCLVVLYMIGLEHGDSLILVPFLNL